MELILSFEIEHNMADKYNQYLLLTSNEFSLLDNSKPCYSIRKQIN